LYNPFVKISFAENLKTLRGERKLSQGKLAAMIGVTQQCISEWENKKTEPTLSYLCELSEIFGVTLDVLCGKTEW